MCQALPRISLLILIALLSGCGSSSQGANPQGEGEKKTANKFFFLSPNKLQGVADSWNWAHAGMEFPASLFGFLTDPDFELETPTQDYDLGFENAFGVGFIGDDQFLDELERLYPDELRAIRGDPRLDRSPAQGSYFDRSGCRFANNDINKFLETCRDNPTRRDIMRRAFWYMLSTHPRCVHP